MTCYTDIDYESFPIADLDMGAAGFLVFESKSGVIDSIVTGTGLSIETAA